MLNRSFTNVSKSCRSASTVDSSTAGSYNAYANLSETAQRIYAKRRSRSGDVYMQDEQLSLQFLMLDVESGRLRFLVLRDR